LAPLAARVPLMMRIVVLLTVCWLMERSNVMCEHGSLRSDCNMERVGECRNHREFNGMEWMPCPPANLYASSPYRTNCKPA
jgi:hypothetical protein